MKGLYIYICIWNVLTVNAFLSNQFYMRKFALLAQKDSKWRVYGIDVPLSEDPGKDDYTVHENLLKIVNLKLGVKSGSFVDKSSVNIIRKSFDAR